MRPGVRDGNDFYVERGGGGGAVAIIDRLQKEIAGVLALREVRER
jgi:hypothetical protein